MHNWRHTQNPIRNNWKCVRIGKQNELWRCEELYCIGIDAISTVTQVEENNMSRSPSNNSPKSLGGPKGSGVRSQFQVNPCISHAILNLKKNLSSLAFGFFHKKSLWFYYILVPRHQNWSNSIAVCVYFFRKHFDQIEAICNVWTVKIENDSRFTSSYRRHMSIARYPSAFISISITIMITI